MYKAMKAAALLAVVLMTAMCATTVLTDGTDAATAWDGTSDTGWYNESDSTFEISTAEQLAGLAEKVNEGVDFSGKTITLTADIDLGGKEWTPIGDGSRLSSISTGNSFDGKFIGGDHTITGLTISSTTNANKAIGLFGVIDGGNVSGLTFLNVNINVPTSELAGSVAGLIVGGGVVENVTVGSTSDNSTVVAAAGVGGIAGRMIIEGTVKNCTNYAEITGTSGNRGGIVGAAYYAPTGDGLNIIGCTNYGAITSTAGGYTGGIVGLSTADVDDCHNKGAVSAVGTSVGGIVGEQKNGGTVENCTNAGDVSNRTTRTTSAGAGTGGIVGWTRYSNEYDNTRISVIVCSNTGDVTSDSYGVGGIVGLGYHSLSVTGCDSTGTFTGTKMVAGIVGGLQSAANGDVCCSVGCWFVFTGNTATDVTTVSDGPNVDEVLGHWPSSDLNNPTTPIPHGSYWTVYGNKYVASGTTTEAVFDGIQSYFVIDVTDSDGTVTRYGYNTLADAVSNAEAGETIVMLADVSTEPVTIDKDITLDLAGHKITLSASAGDSDPSTATYTIRNLGELSIIGNGTIESGSDRAIYNGGTLDIDGLTLKGDIGVIATLNTVTTIKNATFENTIIAVQNRGALTIESGSFSNSATTNSTIVSNAGTLTINGGTFTSGNVSTLYNNSDSTMDINGGTFNSAGVVLYNLGTANLTDVSMTSTNTDPSTQGTITYTIVNTGTLTVDGDSLIKCVGPDSASAGCVLNGEDSPSASGTWTATFDGTRFEVSNGKCVYSAHGTVTLTDCTLSREGTASQSWEDSIIAVAYEAVANVNNCNFETSEYGFYVFSSGGTINVDEGTYTSSGGKGLFRLDVDTTKYSGAVAKATIKSGIFTGDLVDSGSTAIGTALSVQVSGGSFSEEFDQEYVVEGSGLFKNADGTWGIYESVTVTFQYGSGESKVVEVRKGFPVASDDVPTPGTGQEYTWKSDGEAIDPYTHEFTANATLVADATVDASYTVTFMDGEDLVGAVRAVEGAVTAPAAPMKDGYTFAGWVSADGSEVDLNSITSDLTVYTSWTLAEPTVTVSQTEGDGVVYVDVSATHTLDDGIEYTYTLVGADGASLTPENGRFTVTASGQYTLTVEYKLTSDPTYTGKVTQTVDVTIPSPVDPEPEPTPGGDDDEPGTTPGDDDEDLPPIIRPGGSGSSSGDDDTVTIVACAAAAAVAAILAVFLIYAYRKD